MRARACVCVCVCVRACACARGCMRSYICDTHVCARSYKHHTFQRSADNTLYSRVYSSNRKEQAQTVAQKKITQIPLQKGAPGTEVKQKTNFFKQRRPKPGGEELFAKIPIATEPRPRNQRKYKGEKVVSARERTNIALGSVCIWFSSFSFCSDGTNKEK